MTKKDYELIAGIIRNANHTATKFKDTSGESMLVHLTLEFCDELVKENPRFNRELFLNACKVNN